MNNFAISSADIGAALQRSAASLSVSGNSLEESIALVTAAQTVAQNAESVGRRLPTLKTTISVKGQRWLRPRKVYINNITLY